MKTTLPLLFFLVAFGISTLNAQTKIPDSYYSTKHFKTTMLMEDYLTQGYSNRTNIPVDLLDTSGQTDVSDVIQFYIDSSKGGIFREIILPLGHFLIEKPIRIRDSIFLKGTSASETIINCQVGEGKACFEIKPDNVSPLHILPIRTSVSKGTNELVFPKDTLDLYLGSDFTFGYMAMVSGKDSDRISMPLANGMVKEHFKGFIDTVKGQSNNRILYFNILNYLPNNLQLFFFKSGFFYKNNKFGIQNELCLNYSIEYEPRIEVYKMIKDAGLGCITINRTEHLSGETPNILLQNATECVVKAVVSNYCNHSHILVKNSLHNVFKRNYLSYANDTLGEETGIGLNVQAGSAHNCFFDNVMKQLKHSIVVQSGANNNVFISNYSYEPIRSSEPDEVWGDIVLKGNYPFGNLFESNMAEDLVFDNSNGKNGPFNIVHRNMFGGHGIIMKEQNGSDSQVFTGNEIPNQTLGQFLLQDTGHFVFGNKFNQMIIPEGTNLPLENYVISRNYDCYSYIWSLRRTPGPPAIACPYDFLDSNENEIHYPPFGFPFNQPNRDILAMRKKNIEPTCYDELYDRIHYIGNVNEVSKPKVSLVAYPNPNSGSFNINLTGKLSVIDLSGRQIAEFEARDENQNFELLHKGLFILKLTRADGVYTTRVLVQ
jgi:hypothetical protein